MKMSRLVTIRSSRYGLDIELDSEAEFTALLAELAEKFRASSRFFGNAQMALGFAGRELSRAEEDEEQEQEQEETAEVSTLAYVLYSNQNLPENACMEQRLLGFDYCTPADGPISSGFGYRDHPVEGEERFHYGVDIAAQDGSDVCSFADGTVKAVGERIVIEKE